MADGLDPVVQEFIADVTKYVEGLAEATSAANDFRDANLEAAAAVKVLQDQMDNTDGSTTDFADALNGIHDALQVTDDDIQNRYLSNLEDLRSANTDAADTTHDLDAAMRDLEARFGELAFMSDADVGSLHTLEASFSDLSDAIRRGGDDLAEVRDRILEAGAAAGIDEAPLAALAEAFDRVAEAAGDARTKVTETAAASSFGALDNALVGVLGAAEQAGTALGTVGTIIVPLIGLAATLAIALVPFIAGLATAAVGVGAFAAIAVPEITKVWSAVSSGGAALKALDPAERALVGPIRDLKSEFASLEKAIQPEILTAFAEGLKIIKDLMPAFRALLIAAGHALDTFLKNIDNWLKSPSGQKFIHWLEVEGPHAMETFGRDLWDVGKVVGNVFHFLYDTGETFDHHWEEFWHNAAMVIDGFRVGFTQMGHLVESIFNDIESAVAQWVDRFRAGMDASNQAMANWLADVGRDINDVISFFEALPGRITSALSSLARDLFSIGSNAIQGLINGIESMVGSVLSTIGHIASDISGAFSHILGIFSPSRVFHQHGVMLMAGLAEGITAGLPLVQAAMTAAAARVAIPSLAGGYRPGLAGAGVAAGAGGFTWTGNVIVNGSVITQQELRGYVQQAVLDAWTRNRGLGFTPYGYPGH